MMREGLCLPRSLPKRTSVSPSTYSAFHKSFTHTPPPNTSSGFLRGRCSSGAQTRRLPFTFRHTSTCSARSLPSPFSSCWTRPSLVVVFLTCATSSGVGGARGLSSTLSQMYAWRGFGLVWLVWVGGVSECWTGMHARQTQTD